MEATEKYLEGDELAEERRSINSLDIVVVVDCIFILYIIIVLLFPPFSLIWRNTDIRTELRGLLGIKEEFDKELRLELDKRKNEFEKYMEEQRVKLADMVCIFNIKNFVI